MEPLLAALQEVVVDHTLEGHGGGDLRMLAALFDPAAPGAAMLATATDGVNALLTGLAANESFTTGRPIQTDDLQ